MGVAVTGAGTKEGKGQAVNYAGDLPPLQAWRTLEDTARAVLVDVRTRPEWSFVGVPDISSLGKEVVFLEWQQFPGMEIKPDFGASLAVHLRELGHEPADPVLFICRSGARSRAAAMALACEGFQQCFNVAEGFEGDPDPHHHRATVNGWKVAGLPWRQQ